MGGLSFFKLTGTASPWRGRKKVGLSSAGLDHIDRFLEGLIAEGEFAGAVALTARKGRLVRFGAFGLDDIETGSPLRTRARSFGCFDVKASISAAAVMILHDAGSVGLDDPVSKYFPALANPRLASGAPARVPSVRDCLTHGAGYAYPLDVSQPLDAEIAKADLFGAKDNMDFVERLAPLPLAFEPGTAWRYGWGIDVAGAIVEKVSGQTLGAFMTARLFDPLGMVDTRVRSEPVGRRPRLTTIYRIGEEGRLAKVDMPRWWESAGGGLYGTTLDYARFGQMLLNGGELGGRRVLSTQAAKLHAEQPPFRKSVLAGGHGVIHHRFRPGYGHGLGGTVTYDPHLACSPVGRGAYEWAGAAGTWFWLDPEHELNVHQAMVQRTRDPTYAKGIPIRRSKRRPKP